MRRAISRDISSSSEYLLALAAVGKGTELGMHCCAFIIIASTEVAELKFVWIGFGPIAGFQNLMIASRIDSFVHLRMWIYKLFNVVKVVPLTSFATNFTSSSVKSIRS